MVVCVFGVDLFEIGFSSFVVKQTFKRNPFISALYCIVWVSNSLGISLIESILRANGQIVEGGIFSQMGRENKNSSNFVQYAF